ncbi:MAG: XRE family transcriptional regulator [Planctomycetota bacterium]|nr:XRE family transcriptional regulator [Planctomycetota bacterium]
MPEKSFAAALKRLRERAGLSQKALAAKIEMTGSYISQLESGARRAPRPKVITRLCKALGVAERRLQELAALERSPPPIRKRLERANRERGRVRKSRDRLLVTTLFHMARGPRVVDPMAEFLDLPPEQRMLAGRLLGRARKVKSLEEAERESDDLLAEADDKEREILARVLPGVLTGTAPAPSTKDAKRRLVEVYASSTQSGDVEDRIEIDARLGSHGAFFVRIADDEAHPRVEAGDLLLVDPERTPRGGDTVVLHRDGRDLVRTWHKQGGRVRLDGARPDVVPLRMAEQEFDGVVVLLLVRALR